MAETKVTESVQVVEKSKLSSVDVREDQRVLTREEELVVRMANGYAAPGSHRLEQLSDIHPEAADQIEAIQKRALESCGPRDTSAKRSIIQALRRR